MIAILAETDAASGRFAVARLRDEMWLLSHSRGGHKWTITLIDDLDRIAEIAGVPPAEPHERREQEPEAEGEAAA